MSSSLPAGTDNGSAVASGRRRTLLRPTLAVGLGVALLAAVLVSTVVGALVTSPATVWQALFAFDDSSPAHNVVRSLRIPRALGSAMLGAALGVAGAVLQGLTRNPLASPSLMGLNAGAGLAIVIGLAAAPALSHNGLVLLAVAGAGAGAFLSFGISSLTPGGLSPVRLALAGAAVTALLAALTTAVVLAFGIAQGVLFYTLGGLQNVSWLQLGVMAPWWLFGLGAALWLAPSLTVLSLGDDVAAGLGQRLWLTRLLGTVIVLVLAGAALAVGGNIGFVGLAVPHIARSLGGLDYRWIVPASAGLGALLLVLADLGARMVRPPFETPVGLLTALVGVPFLLWLAIREERSM